MAVPESCKNFCINKDTVTLFATVATGLEPECVQELKEKLIIAENIQDIWPTRGKVYFNINKSEIHKVYELRTVDNLFLFVQQFNSYTYDKDKEIAINDIKASASKIDWDGVESFWRMHLLEYRNRYIKNNNIEDELKKSCEITNISNGDSAKVEARFRVSGNRIGKAQTITSVDAEKEFGGALQDITNWKVPYRNCLLFVLIRL